MAQRVQDSGENEILDFMNPYERRIVHVTVNQIPGITSESIGDGFLKRMKIMIWLYNKTFGDELVNLMGSSLLTKLANSGQLVDFLDKKKYKDKKMLDYLGGWLKEGMVFRNKKIVAYHKNWIYFKNLFGINIIGYVEPKPGIPPSPKHVESLIQKMKKNNVTVVLAANYFDENKVRTICVKVGANPVIVPLYVDGAEDTEDVFKLIDLWIEKLKSAYSKH